MLGDRRLAAPLEAARIARRQSAQRTGVVRRAPGPRRAGVRVAALDEKVTAQGQHARKAPWTVHKKSGRVAEPITRVSDWEIYLPQEAPRRGAPRPVPSGPPQRAARYRAGCAEVASFVARHCKRSERMAR